MKIPSFTAVLALLVVVTCTAGFFLAGTSNDLASQSPVAASVRSTTTKSKSTGGPESSPSAPSASAQLTVADTTAADALAKIAGEPAFAPANVMEQRIATLEAQVKSLQQAMAGVSLEKASADRQKLFAAEEGYLKADEYAAAGQHAIAGEGYLTFLQNHPEHPDARDVMKKARDSFLKAEYKDKAFWVQDEMMKANPQHQLADIEELAHIEKDAGLYDRAMEHMAQAAELDPHPESRLWKRLYWAWFVQLQNGNAAGVGAIQQVQQEITNSGVHNPKLNERAQQHLIEWQRQLGRGQ